MDLKHHFGGGLPQISNCCLLPFGLFLGWFFVCLFVCFSLFYFTIETIMRAIALFTELNWVRVTLWERGLNWGGQFYSGYFQFVFPYEEVGF